jgi:uncharacterized protein (DUF362 family)/Pyruvate/2-oxoacid:ferredoxin oxidoreductase delta subunit
MSHDVSLVKCSTYERSAVRDAVRRSVDLVGGMGRYVQPGQRVLLKPNLLRASSPQQAIATHPAVVEAAVRLVQEAGGYPVIGDSPGGPFVSAWLRAVYQSTGMVRLAAETGAELNQDWRETRLSHPDGKLIKALEVGTFASSADVIISLPKLKTHSFMRFTGAVKNLFGLVPGTVKVGYHSKFPEPEQFGDMLIDIATLIRPALSIMDAVVGMDGAGPSAGDPFEIGAVLASADPVSLDLVAVSLVGIDPLSVYTLRAAVERGMVTGRASDVNVVGDPLSDWDVRGFREPSARSSPRRLVSMFSGVVKRWMVAAPRANDRCVACGICVRSCPVQAIAIKDGRARMDLETCIRCYCCHEMCPHRAIDLHKPLLGRLIR